MEKLEKLEKLTTKRLLTYYKKHRKRMLRTDPYDYKEEENDRYSADDREWKKHLLEVKKLLDGREHVE